MSTKMNTTHTENIRHTMGVSEYHGTLTALHGVLSRAMPQYRQIPLAAFVQFMGPKLLSDSAPHAFATFVVHLNPASSAGSFVSVNPDNSDWYQTLCRQLNVPALQHHGKSIDRYSFAELASLQPIRPSSSAMVSSPNASTIARPADPFRVPEACRPGGFRRAQERTSTLLAQCAKHMGARIAATKSWVATKTLLRNSAEIEALVRQAMAPYAVPSTVCSQISDAMLAGVKTHRRFVRGVKLLQERAIASVRSPPPSINARWNTSTDGLSDDEEDDELHSLRVSSNANAPLTTVESDTIAGAPVEIARRLEMQLLSTGGLRSKLSSFLLRDAVGTTTYSRAQTKIAHTQPTGQSAQIPPLPTLVQIRSGAAVAGPRGMSVNAHAADDTQVPNLAPLANSDNYEDYNGVDADTEMPTLALENENSESAEAIPNLAPLDIDGNDWGTNEDIPSLAPWMDGDGEEDLYGDNAAMPSSTVSFSSDKLTSLISDSKNYTIGTRVPKLGPLGGIANEYDTFDSDDDVSVQKMPTVTELREEEDEEEDIERATTIQTPLKAVGTKQAVDVRRMAIRRPVSEPLKPTAAPSANLTFVKCRAALNLFRHVMSCYPELPSARYITSGGEVFVGLPAQKYFSEDDFLVLKNRKDSGSTVCARFHQFVHRARPDSLGDTAHVAHTEFGDACRFYVDSTGA